MKPRDEWEGKKREKISRADIHIRRDRTIHETILHATAIRGSGDK